MTSFAPGQVWRAKRPSNSQGLVNDRLILRISPIMGTIQYDSPSVGFGRRYPSVTIDTFEKWAGREVSAELPKDEWQPWDFLDASKNK
ncbi:hypothetical protein [Burkholderia vietnamiensis]|uniref:hypothetical protein n=1 Tax=Burkholderia vietnamiensis TaxID=60552 RepID=UPI0015930E40|nr:hypothetical protein [Burkholderia vietnamiensis]